MSNSPSKEPSPPGIEETLLESMARTDLKDLLTDLSEVALDSALEDGLLKDIPIIGTFAKLAFAAGSLRDRLFAKKIYRFLAALDTVPDDERRAQIDRLASEPKERRKVGEEILLLIDRLEHMDKPALLARAFQALLENRIDKEKFLALAHAILALDMSAITTYDKKFGNRTQFNFNRLDYFGTQFLQAGLLSLVFSEMGEKAKLPVNPGKFPTVTVNVSETGRLFYKIVLERTE